MTAPIRFALVAALLAAAPPTPAAALELAEALAAARTNAVEYAAPAAERERAAAEAAAIGGAYDVRLFGNAQYAHDRSEQQSIFAGQRRERFDTELGARKLFPTGTQVQTSFLFEREKTFFDNGGGGGAPTGGAGGQGGQTGMQPAQAATPGFDPASTLNYNPAYNTYVELRASQPLARNWLGRELKLQRKIAAAATVPAKLDERLQAQIVQAETERLYWRLAALEAQVRLTKRLTEQSRRFAELMAQRVRFGRADQVDVADAESQIVAREGQILDLQLAAEDVRRQLRMRMYPGRSTAAMPVSLPADTLDRRPMPLPATGAGAALDYALKHRLDLAMLAARRAPVHRRQELLDEQTKPRVNAFAALRGNGLEGTAEQSLVDPVDGGHHATYILGLEAEFNLEHTEQKAQSAAATADLVVLDARAREIRIDVMREIELAFAQVEAAQLKLQQAERNVRVLEAKRAAEERRFRQARSEQIAVLRYEIEVTSALAERITALQAAREAEARLRLALHAYPERN